VRHACEYTRMHEEVVYNGESSPNDDSAERSK
jgi:hypothetical protein